MVVLTYNEEKHVERAIRSVQGFAWRVYVVDSGSTDATVRIAEENGARVLSNPFVNHAAQLNWAFAAISAETEWIFRLDADEIVSPELAAQIGQEIDGLDRAVTGIRVHRRIAFMGEPVRHGGVFPIRIVRMVRYGHGACEPRWMDEHLVHDGGTADFLQGEILDKNLNPLTWWIDKHNGYASREVIEIMKRRHAATSERTAPRSVLHALYAKTPLSLRSFLYFLYRFVFRLGFLDRGPARSFHVLQGFFYRFMVDAKVKEVQRRMEDTGCGPEEAIRDLFGIDVDFGTAP